MLRARSAMSLTRWALAALSLAAIASAVHKPKASHAEEAISDQLESDALGSEVTAQDTRVIFHVGNLTGGNEGKVVVDIHPEWAPLGAARFLELVQKNFFNGAHIFRVIPGFVAQFGIAEDPAKANEWKTKRLEDDPVSMKNKKGRISFAAAGKNSRSTQVFVNFNDNIWLDKQGFAPFAEVVEGMDVLEKIYGGYGEAEPYGKGPLQQRIEAEGTQYLKAHFPELSVIKSVELSRTKASKALPAEIVGKLSKSRFESPEGLLPFILVFVLLTGIAAVFACARLDGSMSSYLSQQPNWSKVF